MSQRVFAACAVVVFSGIAVASLVPFRTVIAQGGQPSTPPAQRWQMVPTEMTHSGGEDGKPPFAAKNTVLLDTATGQSWILWVGKDDKRPYVWVKIEHEGE